MVICLEQGADLHMAQLMQPTLSVSCFSKIQIGFTFLVPAHPGSPGKRATKRVCVYCLCLKALHTTALTNRPPSLDCDLSYANMTYSTAPLNSYHLNLWEKAILCSNSETNPQTIMI